MKDGILFNPAIRSAEIHRARFEINSLVCLALGTTFLGTRAVPGRTSFESAPSAPPACAFRGVYPPLQDGLRPR